MERRLARISRYRTRYEIEIVSPTGRHWLLCYAERCSRRAGMEIIRERAARIVAAGCPEDADCEITRGPHGWRYVMAGWTVQPTGRTQRECFMAGELDFLEDVTP